MDFLPIFLNLKGRHCTVVGGGEVAARKVALLRQAGAQVTVVSPVLGDTLARTAEVGEIEHIAEAYTEALLKESVLIIAATDRREVNEAVAEAAGRMNIPVNVVDSPDLCTFVMPSIIDRSPVMVAVSTGGSSPVLGRMLRQKLETTIPAGYGQLARLAKAFRDKVKTKFKSGVDRRLFWEKVLEGPIAEMMVAGKEQQATEALEKALDSAGATMPGHGEVYLVGGGPGDPDLLTFKALRLMQQADVVVYDRLVSKEVLELVRRDAERIYAGKERGVHAIPQEGINDLLVKLAKEGKRVCRLKGGDPFIFGRGGEEIETLMEQGIPFQVVPGITAASGCATYSGFPLTHRDYSQSVTFVTGHLKDGTINLNWPALAQPHQTIVFYMGLHGVQTICDQLIANGLPATTPAALVQQGTTRHHRTLIGDLKTLPGIVESGDVKPPTLIVVGEVVKLHEKLNWFVPSAME
ncbi:MAG: siroheme synthase CysG [Acidiferrobacterales bacterium]|jgi:uroporphyrin-III C-methyltransferase/precorrin-2 dehydrogenase/sirohydrochlorin ferrochelatase|nr:siroheme synthase CysG [Acidiferrobacterales bacterium]